MGYSGYHARYENRSDDKKSGFFHGFKDLVETVMNPTWTGFDLWMLAVFVDNVILSLCC